MGTSTADRRGLAGRPHLAGDIARVLRENLSCVTGSVALVTVTAPGSIETCPCCSQIVSNRLSTRGEVGAWNRASSRSWRRLNAYLRRRMWVIHGSPPPRAVAWVAQRQERGADHLHLVFLSRTPDERLRIAQWVALYRSVHARYGFGFVDDPFRVRKNGRDMVFGKAEVAGSYVGRYLSGGQLERFLLADDRSWRPYWISPVLMARSGWSLTRCRWVRQGWRIANGTWERRSWYGGIWLPSWWHHPDHRSWVAAVLGHADLGTIAEAPVAGTALPA